MNHHLHNRRAKLAVQFLLIILLAGAILAGCSNDRSTQTTGPESSLPFAFEVTGEDFLISALDELQSIAQWPESSPGSRSKTGSSPSEHRILSLSKTGSDSIFIYGEVTTGGYGAVVTERHEYPKGILLITVRRTHGKESGHIVTETRRYISFEDFENDEPQQYSTTEVYGLSSDTIVTRVARNGILETFTFRLPVITRTINTADGSVRSTIRYGLDGRIISEVVDATNTLIERRANYGEPDGSIFTQTDYPDGSWRTVRTLGQADGSVLRETTSGG
jgi:hypothetical protein